MKIGKKLLSFLLAMSVSLSAMQMTAWMEELPDDYVGNENSQVTDEFDYTVGYNVPAVMSLLPLEEKSKTVYVDSSDVLPSFDENGVAREEFYVSKTKLLESILADEGLSENDVTVMYSFDNDNYTLLDSDGITLTSLQISNTISNQYGITAYDQIYLMIGRNSEDQLDSDKVLYRVYLYVKNFQQDFVENLTVKTYNSEDTLVQMNETDRSRSGYMDGYIYYYISESVLLENDDDIKNMKIQVTLPNGYSSDNVSVYEGRIYNTGDLATATDVTSKVLTEKYALTQYGGAALTFAINSNGNYIFIPVQYYVSPIKNQIIFSYDGYIYDGYKYLPLYEDAKATELYEYTDVYEKSSIDDRDVCATFRYYDETTSSYYEDNSKVAFACFGSYASQEAAERAGAADIKDTLFNNNYTYIDIEFNDNPYYIDLYLKDGTKVEHLSSYITVIDTDGIVYNKFVASYFCVDEFPEEEEEAPELSNNTHLKVYDAKADNSNGGKDYLDSYSTVYYEENDSYVRNGFQTLFLLNDDAPVTANTIYPIFTASNGARISTADGGIQTSGESAVPFESGKAIQYTASSESGNTLGNYWVTFLTQQQGAKLFVNATNSDAHKSDNGNPEREVLLNDRFGYYHDILIANIGDTELTGLNVKLSDDATGVKLDPYWTIIDSSVKKLAPFTKTYSNEVDHIAKIRLIPEEEDGFASITGSLTISADNGDSVTIDLTGIAGVPQIVTDSVRDGVKYVPYSCVVMTNSMYENDAMKFSISRGKLPDGLQMYPNGEIYGIPTKVGEFTFTVKAEYTGTVPVDTEELVAYKTYTINIADNTDENVDATNEDEQGYSLEDRVSKYVTVYYNGTTGNTPNIDRIEVDCDLFWSEGDFAEFEKAFYIDGKELMEDTDYSAEEGSTKITVHAQTFANIPMTSDTVPHTLAAEFRTDSDELRRSAQNVYIKYVNLKNEDNSGSIGGNGSSSSGNVTVSPNVTTSGSASKDNVDFGSVTAMVRIVDADGNAVPNLSVELHSSPKYATTDKNGVAEFSNVEFGRHTLYIKDPVTNKKISKKFTLVSGFDTSLDGNIITAEVDEIIYLKVSFSDSEITLLSAGTENVSTEAGIFGNDDVINSTNSYAGIAFIVSILLVGGFTVFAVTRRNKA